ncbi:MAG: hypothetical protein Q9195_006146 [Heterodermia aff. obscurata]
MPPKELNFITSNRNKLSEVQTILSDIVPVKSQNIDLPERQGTIKEISLDKCKCAAALALGHEGLNNLLVAYEDKSAQAVCTFAYCEGPEHDPIIFEGRVTVGFK